MSTYLKNMAGYKHNQLKTKSFKDIQMLFDKEMKRVTTFVDMDTELVKGSEIRTEGSSKRAGGELESENLKKQKLEAEVDDDQEEAEMKMHMKIVHDDEVAIDAIPLATKPPIIVDWNIIKGGKMGHFQIIRADGSSKRYSSMIQMLKDFDREYLETLWKLVKDKHGSTRPEEGYKRVLWGDLKVMFEPNVESKHVQSEVVSEQLEIEKDDLSEQGTIGTLESGLLALEGDARVTTLTQTVSSLQGTIDTLESRLLALESDARDFGVVSNGDIPAYMSPGPSYISQGPSHTSPAPTAQKSLSLANRRKLSGRHTPLKFKSPMLAYSRKFWRSTIPPPASNTTMSVPMTTTEPLKDTIHTYLDASNAAQDAAKETRHTEEDLQFKRMEKSDKPNFDLSDLSKIKRKEKKSYLY
ncbi:hypothetical protein Tco_0238561 [Tanacetum coccineum]